MADGVSIELDRAHNAILTLTCPKCGRRQKKKARDLVAGVTVSCACGETSWTFADSELASIQRQINDLKRVLKNFGKSL